MSKFSEIDGSFGTERARILFFHGLGGDAFKTWTAADGKFWPSWLLTDNPGLYGTTVSYDASPSKWSTGSMSLSDRATQLATLLTLQFGSNEVPIVLLGHSLGGNLIKAIIRHMTDHKNTNPKFVSILDRIRLVIFLGTPHAGSVLATIAVGLRSFIRPSAATVDLVADDPTLRDLNLWYRSNMSSSIKHRVFVESRPTKIFGTIVTPSSSDPGIKDVMPIPVDENHIGICKPSGRESQVYRLINEDVSGVINASIPKILQKLLASTVSDSTETGTRKRRVSRIESHLKSLVTNKSIKPFTILLCGPIQSGALNLNSFEFCQDLETKLKNDGFDVIRGENFGLKNERFGTEENALSTEISFIESGCNAVIIIADSIGTWCELGLFSWYVSSNKEIKKKGTDIVVLLDVSNDNGDDFVKLGAFSLAENFGRASYVDFVNYDSQQIIRRMKERRSVYTMDRRGRPKKETA